MLGPPPRFTPLGPLLSPNSSLKHRFHVAPSRRPSLPPQPDLPGNCHPSIKPHFERYFLLEASSGQVSLQYTPWLPLLPPSNLDPTGLQSTVLPSSRARGSLCVVHSGFPVPGMDLAYCGRHTQPWRPGQKARGLELRGRLVTKLCKVLRLGVPDMSREGVSRSGHSLGKGKGMPVRNRGFAGASMSSNNMVGNLDQPSC